MAYNKKNYKKREQEDANTDTIILPANEEVESIVLGSVIIEQEVLYKVAPDFRENLFVSEANKTICRAINSLWKQNSPVDLVTISQELKKVGALEMVGGAYYISNLTNRVGGTANIEFHIKVLQQEALKRSLLSICSKSIAKIQDPTEDIFDIYQNTQIKIDESIKDVLRYEIQKVEEIHHEIIRESIEIQEKGHKSGVVSNIRMLDNVTNGFQKSDLIILAGRPGMGKTAAAVSFALFPSLYQKEPVAIFSLEMSNQQLVSRMQSQISGVNVSRIVKKQLISDEINKIINTGKIFEDAPLYIDDTPNISLIELKSKARKLVRENGVKMIIIDYLQLMRSGMNVFNREQEIAEISRGLKGLAKELEIPIVALSQLSRVVESRTDKKPALSDLRESGQIEQDADMVMFCYRPEYYGIEQYEVGSEQFDTRGLFMLIIAKHRNGELGEIPMLFIHEQTKITNYGESNQINSTFVQQDVHSSQQAGIIQNTSFLEQNNINNEDEDLPF